jgi:DNA-binding MarR family transcriptional regulator
LNHSPSRKRGLGASLRLSHHLYGKLLQKQLIDSDLSMAQYIHLRSLREEGALSQSELSAILGIEKASSRRVVVVSLSDQGRKKIDQAMKAARTAADRASRGFEEDELLQLFAAMDKLIGNLSS